MKNITVSIDDKTHRLARIKAAELETSVSGLVRDFLRSLVESNAAEETADPNRERRSRLISEVFEDVRSSRPGFKAAGNLQREGLYDGSKIR